MTEHEEEPTAPSALSVSTEAAKGSHLAREALGGYMALEAYDEGLQAAISQLAAFASHYGLSWSAALSQLPAHALTCDMGEDCACGGVS